MGSGAAPFNLDRFGHTLQFFGLNARTSVEEDQAGLVFVLRRVLAVDLAVLA